MKNKLTPNRAAALTRQNVVRKVKRMACGALAIRRCGRAYIPADTLIEWLRAMDVRQNKRKGGLGRR